MITVFVTTSKIRVKSWS